jgi:hypothetical protein
MLSGLPDRTDAAWSRSVGAVKVQNFAEKAFHKCARNRNLVSFWTMPIPTNLLTKLDFDNNFRGRQVASGLWGGNHIPPEVGVVWGNGSHAQLDPYPFPVSGSAGCQDLLSLSFHLR